MYKIIIVGTGGFLGTILRYLITGYVHNFMQGVAFPYGTLVVNVTGCFLIGIFSHIAESQIGMTTEMRLLLMVGLLGSFTTYSTFGSETINLLEYKRYLLASINIGAHMILGLSSVLLGRFAIITIWR